MSKLFYIKQFSLVQVEFQCQKQFHFKQEYYSESGSNSATGVSTHFEATVKHLCHYATTQK